MKTYVALACVILFLCLRPALGQVACGGLIQATAQTPLDTVSQKIGLRINTTTSLNITTVTVYYSSVAGAYDTQVVLYTDDTANQTPFQVIASSQNISILSNQTVRYTMASQAINPSTFWLVINASSTAWVFASRASATAATAISLPSGFYTPANGTWGMSGSGYLPAFTVDGCSSTGVLQSPIPSLSPSPSISPPRSATPSLSLSPTASASPSAPPPTPVSPSPSQYISPLPTPSPLPALSLSPLPTLSPSSTPLPKLAAVSNVSVDFGSSVPAFNMSSSIPLGNNVSTLTNASNVVSTFSAITIGGKTVPATNLSNAVTVSNSSTYVYSASLDDSTQLAQSYGFYQSDASGSFAGVTFDIPANSVKWSVNLTSTSPTAATTLRYLLTGLLTSSSSGGGEQQLVPASGQPITWRSGVPGTNMTTYYVPLFTKSGSSTTVVATVVLFDVALVDGDVTPIEHDVVEVNSTADDSTGAQYAVVLAFPAFESSLYYDPSLGLGVLLGSDGKSGGGGGDNTGLIIGVAVAVPLAVAVVVAVVVGSVVFFWWKKRRERLGSGMSSINFDSHDGFHDL